MRKISIISTIILINLTYTLNAQEPNETEKKPKYEVSLDMYKFLNPVSTSSISFSFDYLLNKSESIGFTPTYKDEDYSLAVNYKHFFSKKYAQGFYTEVGTNFRMGKYYPSRFPNFSTKQNYKALDVYLKLGYKLVSKRNFFLDVNAGLSKTILGRSTYQYTYPYTPFSVGVKIGKRF